jgi:hypothetical protein
MGCSPEEWSELILHNQDSVDIIDEALTGQIIEIDLKTGSTLKVEGGRAFRSDSKCTRLRVSKTFLTVHDTIVQFFGSKTISQECTDPNVLHGTSAAKPRTAIDEARPKRKISDFDESYLRRGRYKVFEG